MSSKAKNIAVIGAGPAGLMAAEVLAEGGAAVTVYDAMPSVARKFLMAGRGGLNLTHSEELSAFLSRYREAAPFLGKAIRAFPPQRLRDWCEALGEPTFVGSSGRVFPKSFKASPLLRAWLRRLDSQGVRLALRHRWSGWGEQGNLLFETLEGRRAISVDATVLALGGASWPRLGSDGTWTNILASKAVAITKLRPANCGFTVAWSDIFRDRFEGQPLKGITLSFGEHTVRGEAVITREGIEGGGLYALSAELREAVAVAGGVTLHIALRPDLSTEDLVSRLSAPRGKQSLSNVLRKMLQLSPVAIGLLQEATINAGRQLASLRADELAALINAVPVKLTGTSSLARAISSAGGIALDELDADFMIKQLPGVFAAGEMLDWEAPTGGYLLQACFATGVAAGRGVLKWLDAKKGAELTVDLPDPWSRIADESLRARLEAELKKELGPEHCLANVSLTIIAKRDDKDDVLAVLDGGRVAQIHITWSGQPEADPRWPASLIYESMTDWLTAWDSL